MLHDCGVYALRVAYALSLLRGPLKLRFRFVRLPSHLALVITGPELRTFVVNNNDIQQVSQEKLGAGYTRAAGAGRLDERAFVGDVAAAYFLQFIDMPERVVEGKFTSNTKAEYRSFYKKLQRDVLKPAKGELAQFHLRYLEALADYKRIYNSRVLQFWNVDGPVV